MMGNNYHLRARRMEDCAETLQTYSTAWLEKQIKITMNKMLPEKMRLEFYFAIILFKDGDIIYKFLLIA